MRVIALSTLRAFWDKHPQARESLEAWHAEALHATWQRPADIKARYSSASFVGSNRVVFNIKGNDYRLVAAVLYRAGVLYIKFVGTHAEYDRIDVSTVEHRNES